METLQPLGGVVAQPGPMMSFQAFGEDGFAAFVEAVKKQIQASAPLVRDAARVFGTAPIQAAPWLGERGDRSLNRRGCMVGNQTAAVSAARPG